MVKTIISLREDEKAWLDAQAAEQRLPMTELVRRAVSLLRAQTAPAGPPLDELLRRTRGIWRRGDGLEWQRKLRDEWSR